MISTRWEDPTEFRNDCTTAAQSILRNDIVAALAEAVFVPHASKNGKTWLIARKALGYGQKVFTFADEANADLVACGAEEYRDELIRELSMLQKNDSTQ